MIRRTLAKVLGSVSVRQTEWGELTTASDLLSITVGITRYSVQTQTALVSPSSFYVG
ncbi:MAG TPA: hypothetical protein VNZ03_19580 [Terriglobales bacterium]|nr:hypothetical protein [Terriglobales bacterium]